MSKKSATDTIKKLNPKNVSAVIPQSLDMIKSLKMSKGNPKMIDSVGAQNLLGMFQQLAKLFGNKKQKKNNEEKQTEEELLEEQQLLEALNKLEREMGLPVSQ